MSSVGGYYKLFGRRWRSEFWTARGKQLSAFVVVNVVTLFLDRNEPTAWAKAKPSIVANLITFVVFAIWHVIRVPSLLRADQEKHVAEVTQQAEELRRQTAALKAFPARITVTPYELQRTLRVHGKEEGRNIFLRAKVELLEPLHLDVVGYRMELSRDGATDTSEFVDDLNKWEITDWSKNPIPHEDMRPLPMKLESGSPVEGWVHFISNRSNQELDQSRVRLFVHTTQGTGNAEIPPGHEYWNATKNKMVVEK